MSYEAAKFFKEEIDSNTGYLMSTTHLDEPERLKAYFQLLDDWNQCLSDEMGWSHE